MRISLRENIYSSIKEDILTCRVLPNSDLREQSLAEKFSVSKSPVRDALLRLEQERLVVVLPRQGYRVAPISIVDAREMFQLRKVLEPACAEAAAQNATDRQVAELESFRSLDGPNVPDVFIEYNRGFHFAVCRASGNARMARIACDLIEQMERMIRFSVGTVSSNDKTSLVREHGGIIDAIVGRDRRLAATLVRQHVADAEKRVMSGLSRAAVQMMSEEELMS